MSITKSALWLPCALAILNVGDIGAQRVDARRIVIPVARLQATSDTARMRAYYEMVAVANAGRNGQARKTNFLAISARQQNDLALALIALLERENAVFANAPRGSLSEDYAAGYYPDLFVTVARIKDLRALKALLPAIGRSAVVIEAVAGFGAPAIPNVVAMLGDGDEWKASGAAMALGRIATGSANPRPTGGAMASMRSALLRTTRETNSFIVRRNAIEALAPFDGADIRAEMERIAATDAVAIGKGPGAPRQFVVRDAAKTWLAKHPRQ